MILRILRVQVSTVCILIAASASVCAQTEDKRAESLFREGYILYQQRYGAVAITPLEEAASRGHPEAAYWVGEILRKRYSFITGEADTFYRQAADGGEVYAMLRFAQKGNMCGTLRDCDYDHKQWLDRAEETALARAETGDTVAMMELFSVSWMQGNEKAALNWTLKAAEAGDAVAQHWLAIGLLSEREMGFYWTEASRRKDVLKWLKASAEQGFPKAIENLAVEYYKDGRFEDCHEWVDRMGQTDYFDALYNYGLVLMDGPEGMYRYPETRSVDGLATLLALHRQTGSSAVQRSIDRRLPDLDPEIVNEARARSENLLVDTPILHYLPKFGI